MKLSLTIVYGAIFCFLSLPGSGQNVNAVDSLELAIHLAKNENQKLHLLIALSEEYQTNQPGKSAEFAQRAMALADSIGDKKGQLSSRRILAEISWKSSDYRSALHYAARAREIAVDLNDLEEEAVLYRVYGYIYSDLGDYKESSRYMFESLRIAESIGGKKEISMALNSIGYVYFEQEQYEKALDYYASALSISREINDRQGISRGLNNLAAVYGNLKDYANVKRYLKEAIQINRKTGQRYWEGINYMNLGNVFLDENMPDSSSHYFKKAIQVFEELGHMLHLSNALIGLSRYYLAVDSIQQSEISVRRAYMIGKTHHLKKVTATAAEQLHRLYHESGVFDSAYYYGILHYQLKDSLQLEQSVIRMSQLELMYEFEKINHEKRIIDQKRDFIYLIVVISLVFAMVVGFVITSSRQKIRAKNLELDKKQLESALEIKNKELAFNVMSLMKKNEMLSVIAGKLMEVREDAVKEETKSAIKKIARDLQKASDDEVWKEFETRFKQVHGEFYKKLLKEFPDLTPNEQKLCAFLKLNLSTKEISELTGQRPGTIEIARSRLRRKLGLSNSQINLVSFLSTY